MSDAGSNCQRRESTKPWGSRHDFVNVETQPARRPWIQWPLNQQRAGQNSHQQPNTTNSSGPPSLTTTPRPPQRKDGEGPMRDCRPRGPRNRGSLEATLIRFLHEEREKWPWKIVPIRTEYYICSCRSWIHGCHCGGF